MDFCYLRKMTLSLFSISKLPRIHWAFSLGSRLHVCNLNISHFSQLFLNYVAAGRGSGRLVLLLTCQMNCYFRSLWSGIFLFQGGPLTNQESPVSFPKKLYRRIHNATVISGSMDRSICQCFLVLTANNRVPPSVQVDSQLAFLRDSLKLIQRLWLKLFHHDDLSSVTWGATNSEHFLMTIIRQHRGVKRCVSQRTVAVQLTPTHPISVTPSGFDTGTPPVSTVGKLVVFECSDTQWNSLKPT